MATPPEPPIRNANEDTRTPVLPATPPEHGLAAMGGPNPMLAWQALNEIQQRVQVIEANDDADAGQYTYRFLNLQGLVAELRGPFEDAGLMFSQYSRDVPSSPTKMDVRTIYMHIESGSWVDLGCIISMGQNPQKDGGAYTYAKRYALGANLGIQIGKDDDGRAASPPAAPASDVRELGARFGALTDPLLIEQAKQDIKSLGLPPMKGAHVQEWDADQLALGQKLAHRLEVRQKQVDATATEFNPGGAVPSSDGPRSREEMVADAKAATPGGGQ